ncbi:MAG: response regulator [Alphaproteobacteria bacterium]|nr:response regulator [Alphaproteobacteria bacterium]MBU2082457.1 response regulator [Alphaproteobacteria bacterium]MBU2141468.1 response regulator [Alphaproteobacteria bacterium]MBU2197902.1 response regulator [Alphaproteobacteria bacterium]
MQENEPISNAPAWLALDQMQGGFIVYRPDGTLLFANKAAREHWPVLYSSMDEGVSFYDSVARQIRSLFPRLNEATFQVRHTIVMDAIRKCKDLDMVTATGRHVVTSHSRIEDGHLIGVTHDVTDLVQREISLNAARRHALMASEAKSEFLASMSHEIRTPLNGIIGMAEGLRHRVLGTEEAEMVDTIVESSHTLLLLLNDILDLSRIEAGRLEITPVVENVRDRISWIERNYKPLAEKKGLYLKVAFDPRIPEYLALDTTRVRQCIDNLVSNALKFTNEGGVTLAVMAGDMSRNGRIAITVHVSDTGIGISDVHRSKLFQNFQQADSSTTRQHGGSGLGLAISRKLAQLMGGDVTCVSKLGEGSVFSFSFEARVADAPKKVVKPKAGTGNREVDLLKGVRALVVDDNTINRRVARIVLEPLGVIVTDVPSGKDALARLDRETFDIVLLDVHMPNMAGPEVLRRIRDSRERWSNIPVIALTADAMNGDRERYIQMGMDDYIAKPIIESELVAALTRVHDAKGIRRLDPAQALTDLPGNQDTASGSEPKAAAAS